jgi:hypothetical protein
MSRHVFYSRHYDIADNLANWIEHALADRLPLP